MRVNASIHRAYWGTGNTNALRLNVYFPCPLQCIEALTRTRLSINRVSASGGLQAGSVQLSNEHELSKEPKCDTRQISNLMRVSLSVSGESRRQAGLRENTCGQRYEHPVYISLWVTACQISLWRPFFACELSYSGRYEENIASTAHFP